MSSEPYTYEGREYFTVSSDPYTLDALFALRSDSWSEIYRTARPRYEGREYFTAMANPPQAQPQPPSDSNTRFSELDW